MLEVRWEGTRPEELIARGALNGPVYVARILGRNGAGFVRDFLGTSTIIRERDEEEVRVPVAKLKRGDLLEIREGLPLESLGVYERFAIWDGRSAQRVDLAYALHVLQTTSANPTKWK